MYTFYLIFSAVGMSNSWRRDQNIGLCPYSLLSFSWSHTCPAGLSLYGFVSFEFLCELAWLQWEGRRQPQPKLCLKPAGSGTHRRWDLQGEKCSALGEVPSLPGELLTAGILFKGDSIVLCGHGFGLQWWLDVVLLWCASVSRGYLLCRFHVWFQAQLLSMAIPDGHVASECTRPNSSIC